MKDTAHSPRFHNQPKTLSDSLIAHIEQLHVYLPALRFKARQTKLDLHSCMAAETKNQSGS